MVEWGFEDWKRRNRYLIGFGGVFFLERKKSGI